MMEFGMMQSAQEELRDLVSTPSLPLILHMHKVNHLTALPF